MSRKEPKEYLRELKCCMYRKSPMRNNPINIDNNRYFKRKETKTIEVVNSQLNKD